MHRRRSLGFCLLLLLLLVLLAGPASALPEPRSMEASAVESSGLLDRVWEWLTSLLTSGEPADSSIPGGEHIQGLDGGNFMDPNGNS